ncbi:Sodium:sulfate symporter transmembrane region [Arthrobacter subterraneus]|uniref:Sodium:sulfate symporter transmembrane region n=1 Tax=Arthrobacter subterraneus TaxID=335973 RepID=A0A1G8K4G7_9MICC|nr:Sodium:sulfate symporter transmembrane region [Arthrobacter subterraneus]
MPFKPQPAGKDTRRTSSLSGGSMNPPGPQELQDRDVEFKSPGERAPAEDPKTHRIKWTGFAVGLGLALLVYFVMPADLAHPAKLTAATAVLMGVWWMTEAIPIPATALLPLIIFPVLGEDVAVDDVGASYGSNIIFLFMGGFLLALAMQRWNLHRRIALQTVRVMGTKPAQMVAGFMVATAFLSMWVSDTATAVMMLPIGVSVLLLLPNLLADAAAEGKADGHARGTASDPDLEGADPQSAEVKDAIIKSNFGTALMLGIAYAASIGSLGTIIGTPPNTLLVGYCRRNMTSASASGSGCSWGFPYPW